MQSTTRPLLLTLPVHHVSFQGLLDRSCQAGQVPSECSKATKAKRRLNAAGISHLEDPALIRAQTTYQAGGSYLSLNAWVSQDGLLGQGRMWRRALLEEAFPGLERGRQGIVLPLLLSQGWPMPALVLKRPFAQLLVLDSCTASGT